MKPGPSIAWPTWNCAAWSVFRWFASTQAHPRTPACSQRTPPPRVCCTWILVSRPRTWRRAIASCWSAVVADVSGKGVSSALLASLLQGAFLTVSENPELMSRKLDRISQFLNERTEGGKYATIFYCLLHRTGRLRYINAGHCAPPLISSGGQYEYLEATAMPAGLLQDAEFSVVERQLSPGDRLVIYTDGVTEAEN